MKRVNKRLLLAGLAICSLLMPDLATANQHSRGQSVRVKTTAGGEMELYAGSYALVVGVSGYTNGWESLPDVVNDVVEVKKALETQSFTVETLMNPTRSQFDGKVRDFIARYGQNKDNRLLIYFSGHGHTLQTNDNRQRELGYLVPADAPLPRPDVIGTFKSHAISMNEINNYAEQIEAKHVLFVFDSCFSGSIFKTRSGGIPEPIRDKTSEPVRQFITAGNEKQQVPARSIFRRVFVQAIGGAADMNRDGYITGMELGEFLHSEVTTQSRRLQTPQSGKILNPDLNQGDFVFVVPGAPLLGSTPPPQSPNRVPDNPPKPAIDSSTTGEVTGKRWEMLEDKNLMLPVNSAWTSTLIQVSAGQEIKVTGSGKPINLGANGYAGPEGTYKDDRQRPLRDCQTGALLARVGDQTICIGREATFKVSSSGVLYLGINEGQTADNSGSFVVNIRQYQLK
jgi:hypothetical protein